LNTATERETDQPTVDTTGPTTARTIEERGGRAALVGATVGFVTVAVAVSLLALATGLDRVTSFGLGAFVGSWGGLGFGGMLAASIEVAGREGR
jgi:hypothetical protein